MKERFKNIELGLVGFFITAFTLKLLHIDVADKILMISGLILAFFYLFMGISASGRMNTIQVLEADTYLSMRDSKFFLIAGISLSISIVGIIYYFFHWEGNEMMLGIGTISGVFCILLGYVSLRTTHPALFQFLFGRLLPISVMAGVCYFQTLGKL